MIESLKIRQYLLYAAGEIILVVVGILIALQINNDNQRRQDGKRELSIVKALDQEMRANLMYLESRRSYLKNRIERGATYFLQMSSPGPPMIVPDSVVKHLQMTFGASPFTPIRTVLQSVLNGSEVNLIQNDSLKFLLSQYEIDLNATETFDLSRRRVRSEFFSQYYRTHIGGSHYSKSMLDVAKEYHYLDTSINPKITRSRFNVDWHRVLSDATFEAYVAEILEMYYWSDNRLLTTTHQITQIRDFIEDHY